jgi:hypothetical protein
VLVVLSDQSLRVVADNSVEIDQHLVAVVDRPVVRAEVEEDGTPAEKRLVLLAVGPWQPLPDLLQ